MRRAHNPHNNSYSIFFFFLCAHQLLFSTWIILTAAARALSKEGHALQNTELRVRKPPRKDQHRLLLRGLGPSISDDLIEMYVENILGLNLEDYQLYFTPARDSVLIQFRQPLSQGDSFFPQIPPNVSRLLFN